MKDWQNRRAKRRYFIYGAYSKVLSGARHHASLQANYRIMASTWLLATFSAIGFLLSVDELLPFDHLLAVVFICFIGITGLYFLWYEDTVVQELLLDMHVVEGLSLEKKHLWLPQLHHCFLHLYKKGQTPIVKVLFFIGCKTILIIIMTISLCMYLYPKHIILILFSILFFLIFNYYSSKFMLYKTAKIEEFLEYLTNVDIRD